MQQFGTGTRTSLIYVYYLMKKYMCQKTGIKKMLHSTAWDEDDGILDIYIIIIIIGI